jgi:glycosyltransferase involved in cell wall biosynthesis
MAPGGLVTVSGAAVGADPFDRRSWSGSSYFLMSELARRRVLRRAISAHAGARARALALARTFSTEREVWRNRLYLDVAYRDSLTAGVRRALTEPDLSHGFLQIAGYYDVPSVLPRERPCYAYYDGNLAIRMRAPYPLRGVGARTIERSLQYERDLLRRMRRVFTMSDYLRTSFIEDYGVPADRVCTIGGGVNLDTVPPPRPDKRYDTDEILFVGVAFERKGGWVLLDAFRELRARIPGARLHIVGPPPLAIPPRLLAGVHQHGFLDRDDPAFQGLLERCAVFAMPSLYEAFGIAPLEAMLHQMPAVVTGDGALGETVEDGRSGCHVRAGDAEQLAATLASLLGDPSRMRELGAAARERVIETYTWPRVVERMIAAIGDGE